MIVLVEPFGNHSNRLFQTLHYEAWSLENGIPFKNLAFGDMGPLYPEVAREKTTLTQRLVKKLFDRHFLKSLEFSSPEELERVADRSLLLVGGWNFKVPNLTTKYRGHFARRYSIDPGTLADNPVHNCLTEWKRRRYKVVGIHVRRGDYRGFNHGKYFYSDAVFFTIFKRMRDLIRSQGFDARFVVFSDEVVDYSSIDGVEHSNNPWHIDHALMAACDYLIGPPSTFTLWASYLGEVPFFHIHEPDVDLDLDDFSIAQG